MPDQFLTDERPANRKGDATHTEVTTGAVTTPVAAANPDRRYLLIQNIGPGAGVFLRFDEAVAVVDEGLRLLVGESFEWPRSANNALYRGPVNAISLAGTEVLLVSEA